MLGLPATSSICTRFSRSGPISRPMLKSRPNPGSTLGSQSSAGLSSLSNTVFMKVSVNLFIIGSIGNHQLRLVYGEFAAVEYGGRGRVDQHACAVVRNDAVEPFLREGGHVPLHPARNK